MTSTAPPEPSGCTSEAGAVVAMARPPRAPAILGVFGRARPPDGSNFRADRLMIREIRARAAPYQCRQGLSNTNVSDLHRLDRNISRFRARG